MNQKYYLVIIGILAALVIVLLIVKIPKNNSAEINSVVNTENTREYQIPVGDTANEKDTENSYVNMDPTPTIFETKKVTRNTYSFESPKNWIVSDQTNVGGCLWDAISNDTGDGHRMAGEIGIYQKSCFNIANALGKKEYTEKYGYYIIAFYDRESGTTVAEELETKAVYQKVVDTFAIKTVTTQTYQNHGMKIELPVGSVPREYESEAGPGYSINLTSNTHLSYITDASWWEQYVLTGYTYVKDQKIGTTTFKVYTYSGATLYWFKQGNVGYEFSGDISLLDTFQFVGWN